MNILVTLFGGVVLVALIYYGLRLVGVPNYWRGVISGVVPLLAFAVYANDHWSGLDVLAMHTAVYLSAATALTLMGTRQAEGKHRIHWAPLAIAGFFLVLFVIDGAFLYVSKQGLPPIIAHWLLPDAGDSGLHTAFSGVVSHGEDAANAISQHLAARDRLSRLGWRVEVSGMDALAQSGAAEVKVRAHTREDVAIGDAAVTLELFRPAQTKPSASLNLEFSPAGVYQGWLKAPGSGVWIVVVHVIRGKDEFQAEQQVNVAPHS
jgi:nitrogen fixation protein FixH